MPLWGMPLWGMHCGTPGSPSSTTSSSSPSSFESEDGCPELLASALSLFRYLTDFPAARSLQNRPAPQHHSAEDEWTQRNQPSPLACVTGQRCMMHDAGSSGGGGGRGRSPLAALTPNVPVHAFQGQFACGCSGTREDTQSAEGQEPMSDWCEGRRLLACMC